MYSRSGAAACCIPVTTHTACRALLLWPFCCSWAWRRLHRLIVMKHCNQPRILCCVYFWQSLVQVGLCRLHPQPAAELCL